MLEGSRRLWLRVIDASNQWSTFDDRGDITIIDERTRVIPNDAAAATEVPFEVRAQYSDQEGVDTLRFAELRVSVGFTNGRSCRLRYDQPRDNLLVYDGSSWLSAGRPGEASSVVTPYCTLNAEDSTATVVSSTRLDLSLDISFDAKLEGVMNLWLRSFRDGQWNPAVDYGDLTIGHSDADVIDGYTDAQSYDQHAEQQVYVNSQALSDARINLHDILGNVVDSVVFDARPQQVNLENAWRDGFGFEPSFRYNVGDLRSGVYLWANKIPFVVKDSSGTSPIRVVLPTNTMAAYNCEGGRSLYNNKCGVARAADVVTFQRPHQMTSYVSITGDRIPRDRAWGTPFFWWMEQQRERLGVGYGALADSDLDDPASLAGADVLVLPGHSEYWTRAARETVDAFVANGGDLAVLSGNTMWWQSRYEDDGDTLVVYKSLDDPVEDVLQKTVQWRDPVLDYPIEASIGAEFTQGGFSNLNPPDGAPASWLGYKIVAERSPLLEGTKLRNGDIAFLDFEFTEYDGAPIAGFHTDGTPVIDAEALGFHRVELIGFDHGYREVPTIGHHDRISKDTDVGQGG